MCVCCFFCSCLAHFFFCKQKTSYEMRISDWSSDLCSSDLLVLLYVIGALGFVMRLYSIPVAPAVIGLILGPLAEQQFRRALSISQGDATVFFTSPLSA